MMLAYIVLGLVLGGGVAVFIMRARHKAELLQAQSQTQNELSAVRERLGAREADIMRLEREAIDLRTRAKDLDQLCQNLTNSRTELEVKLNEQQRFFEEKSQGFQKFEDRFRESFAALSSQALQANNQQFLDLAKASFGDVYNAAQNNLEHRERNFADMISPIRESLGKVDTKIAEMEKERVGAYHGIRQQVESLINMQGELRRETANLVRALRAPSTRGRWGEIQLRRVVEMAGMLDHCDFFEQQSVSDEDRRLRPDMIVRLPAGKSVVVDAKAPLHAYLEAHEAQDDAVRAEKLSKHAEQVRKHIQDLSQKAYWDQFKPAPEFVVLFLPGEPFFSAALEYDPALIEYGVDRKVILATPTTLISLLRAIAYGWRQESLAENAREVCELGKMLYNRIADMSQHMQDVGQKLRQSVGAYNKAVGSFEARVMVAARRFKDLEVASADKDIAMLEQLDVQTREVVTGAEADSGNEF